MATNNEWIFENETDKELGIETCHYENGQVCKRARLSDGRWAESRKLKGSDAKEINRIVAGVSERYQLAIAAKCLKLDDKPVTVEDIEDMWMDDYNTVMVLAAVNFPIAQNA